MRMLKTIVSTHTQIHKNILHIHIRFFLIVTYGLLIYEILIFIMYTALVLWFLLFFHDMLLSCIVLVLKEIKCKWFDIKIIPKFTLVKFYLG